MNAKSRLVHRAGLGVLLAASAVLTAACANGTQAQTANEKPTIDGVNADIHDIALRGVVIQTPPNGKYVAGDNAKLTIVIVNRGGTTDRLTSVSSAAIGDWGSFASASAAQAFLDSQQRGVTSSSSAAASSSSSSSASAAPQPGASSSSAPAATSSSPALSLGSQSVSVPAGESVSFGTPSSKGALLLEDLNVKALYPAGTLTLTFTFARAGSVKVTVPVELSKKQGGATVPVQSSAPGGE